MILKSRGLRANDDDDGNDDDDDDGGSGGDDDDDDDVGGGSGGGDDHATLLQNKIKWACTKFYHVGVGAADENHDWLEENSSDESHRQESLPLKQSVHQMIIFRSRSRHSKRVTVSYSYGGKNLRAVARDLRNMIRSFHEFSRSKIGKGFPSSKVEGKYHPKINHF